MKMECHCTSPSPQIPPDRRNWNQWPQTAIDWLVKECPAPLFTGISYRRGRCSVISDWVTACKCQINLPEWNNWGGYNLGLINSVCCGFCSGQKKLFQHFELLFKSLTSSDVTVLRLGHWTSSFFLFHLPSQVCPNSIAARDGRIREGDRILQVQYDGGLLNTNSHESQQLNPVLTHPTSVSQHDGPFIFHDRALERGGMPPLWILEVEKCPPG